MELTLQWGWQSIGFYFLKKYKNKWSGRTQAGKCWNALLVDSVWLFTLVLRFLFLANSWKHWCIILHSSLVYSVFNVESYSYYSGKAVFGSLAIKFQISLDLKNYPASSKEGFSSFLSYLASFL